MWWYFVCLLPKQLVRHLTNLVQCFVLRLAHRLSLRDDLVALDDTWLFRLNVRT